MQTYAIKRRIMRFLTILLPGAMITLSIVAGPPKANDQPRLTPG